MSHSTLDWAKTVRIKNGQFRQGIYIIIRRIKIGWVRTLPQAIVSDQYKNTTSKKFQVYAFSKKCRGMTNEEKSNNPYAFILQTPIALEFARRQRLKRKTQYSQFIYNGISKKLFERGDTPHPKLFHQPNTEPADLRTSAEHQLDAHIRGLMMRQQLLSESTWARHTDER